MNNFSDNYSACLTDYGDLLTVEDLAHIFMVSNKTIYKEMRSGKFGKPIQIGRAYLVPKVYIISRFFTAP